MLLHNTRRLLLIIWTYLLVTHKVHFIQNIYKGCFQFSSDHFIRNRWKRRMLDKNKRSFVLMRLIASALVISGVFGNFFNGEKIDSNEISDGILEHNFWSVRSCKKLCIFKLEKIWLRQPRWFTYQTNLTERETMWIDLKVCGQLWLFFFQNKQLFSQIWW